MKENNRKAIARRARQRKQRARRVALTLCLIVATMLVSVGGTLAWLTATSGTVTNTFTASDINITLAETTGTQYKMVPGSTITKDPVATVKAGSEACYLFVKIVKSANYDTYLDNYAVADGWKGLEGVDGVYYRTVAASDDDQDFHVLANDQVTVKTSVTKAQMEAIKTSGQPTLTFTAYAVQSENVASAAAAWAIAKPTT